MFRCKVMQADEWPLFQNGFATIAFAAKDPACALFREAGSLGDPSTILITAPETTAIEAMSPGGWLDCGSTDGRQWQLLVGDGNAHELFGLAPGI